MTTLQQLEPYLWYLAGTICLLIGTCIVIWRTWKGAA